jgi:hypothetical protein
MKEIGSVILVWISGLVLIGLVLKLAYHIFLFGWNLI